MATNASLLSEIQSALGASIVPSLTSTSNSADIFEGYIFSQVIMAAKAEGASVIYRDVLGNTPSSFIFRTSPGYIFSNRFAYTHAVITFSNKPALEAHIGVRVVGKSGVLHECDVAVIDFSEAETCRRKSVAPRSNKVLIAVECKFYATSLGLDLARSFIGLVSDISTKNPIFVTNNSSPTLEKLLSERGKKWEHNIIPKSSSLSRLENEFRTAFKHYKAQ